MQKEPSVHSRVHSATVETVHVGEQQTQTFARGERGASKIYRRHREPCGVREERDGNPDTTRRHDTINKKKTRLVFGRNRCNEKFFSPNSMSPVLTKKSSQRRRRQYNTQKENSFGLRSESMYRKLFLPQLHVLHKKVIAAHRRRQYNTQKENKFGRSVCIDVSKTFSPPTPCPQISRKQRFVVDRERGSPPFFVFGHHIYGFFLEQTNHRVS